MDRRAFARHLARYGGVAFFVAFAGSACQSTTAPRFPEPEEEEDDSDDEPDEG